MAAQRVSPHVVVDTANYGSNNSAIVGSDGVILVDAPHRLSDAVAWGEYTATLGTVRFLVNTDHHPDHTIGNRMLPGEVVATKGTRRRLLTEAPSMQYLRDLLGRLEPGAGHLLEGYQVRVPEVVFDASLDLHLADLALHLVARPGHTANSLLAWLPEDRVVFTGDIVCEAGLPSFQDSRLADWFDAIDAVEALDPEIVVPGHGEVTDRAGIARYRDLGRAVVTQVADRIALGQDEAQVVAEVRFEDNIHVETPTCAGYPDDLIESFQIRSITRIYQDLRAAPGLAHR